LQALELNQFTLHAHNFRCVDMIFTGTGRAGAGAGGGGMASSGLNDGFGGLGRLFNISGTPSLSYFYFAYLALAGAFVMYAAGGGGGGDAYNSVNPPGGGPGAGSGAGKNGVASRCSKFSLPNI
jgi:hypothetical protein